MSILAAVAAPEPISFVQLAWAVAMIGFGMLIAYLLGAFRIATIVGPVRPAQDKGVGTVLVVCIAALVTWLGGQFVYGTMLAVRHRATGSTEPFSTADFTPLDYSILATVPFVLGFLVFAINDRFAHRKLSRELGWSINRLPKGVGFGLLAMIAVLPLMLGASIVLEAFYQMIGYDHPTEHDLLTVLGRSRDPITKVLIIGGATLLAPVFEEFLFRGYLQTVLVRAFGPRRRRLQDFSPMHDVPPPPPPAFDVVTAPVVETAATSAMPELPLALSVANPPAPGPAARWAAVVITGLLFAVLHPTWTWPLIFLLAMALGYAYERTGNLWVPVTMHLVFNAFNTVFFLSTRPL